MLLEHGYNDLGIQALLSETGIPKGSFYHPSADTQNLFNASHLLWCESN